MHSCVAWACMPAVSCTIGKNMHCLTVQLGVDHALDKHCQACADVLLSSRREQSQLMSPAIIKRLVTQLVSLQWERGWEEEEESEGGELFPILQNTCRILISHVTMTGENCLMS